MRRKQTILRSAASATLALGVMFSLVQCNEATGGPDDAPGSSSVSTSRPDDDDDDNSGGSSSSSSSSSESGSPLDKFGTVSGGTLTLNNSLTSENADELKEALRGNSNITSVDFSNVTSTIPAGVLDGTGVTKVTVPAGTQVAEGAFSNSSSSTGLTIVVTGSSPVTGSILGGASHVTLDLSGTSLKTIEDGAFSGCTGLTSVTLPEGLETIEDYAFENCSSLTSITLPDSLETIRMGAFSGCTGLTQVDLSACTSLTTIQNQAFGGQTELNIKLPDNAVDWAWNKISQFAFGERSVTFYYGSNQEDLKKMENKLSMLFDGNNYDVQLASAFNDLSASLTNLSSAFRLFF